MLGKNAKAKWIIVCGLGHDEFNRISSYISAKKYGTLCKILTKIQLKFKNLELSDYAKNMKPSIWNQRITSRYDHQIHHLVNESISLGKVYTIEEQVDKVRSSFEVDPCIILCKKLLAKDSKTFNVLSCEDSWYSVKELRNIHVWRSYILAKDWKRRIKKGSLVT